MLATVSHPRGLADDDPSKSDKLLCTISTKASTSEEVAGGPSTNSAKADGAGIAVRSPFKSCRAGIAELEGEENLAAAPRQWKMI
jgi:hypothetical protein